jgi:hypothetical protein
MKSLKIFSVIFSFFLLGCLLFTSCKSKLPEETKNTYVKTIEKVKDTVFVVEKDSSMYQAYIDCVNGKPVLKQSFEDYQNQHPKTATAPKQKEGKDLKIPKVKLSNNGLLTVNCEKEAQRLFATWKEKYTAEITETQKPIYIDKELTTWQNIQLYTGKITLGLLGLTILAFLIRFLITKKLL